MRVNVIHLKYSGKDGNGLENVLFATDSQIATLVAMRNNPERRLNFVKIGNTIFSPIDVVYIEAREREKYELPRYFLDRVKKEGNYPLKIN